MNDTPATHNQRTPPSTHEIQKLLAAITPRVAKQQTPQIYRRCFGLLDLTSLGADDTLSRIETLTRKVVELPLRRELWGEEAEKLPNVASICVYPRFVECVGVGVGNSQVAITSVAGGFPASQTYLEVKMLEMAMAIEHGADEIDVVIQLGEVIEGEYERAGGELKILRAEAEGVILKVILETGVLQRPDLIWNAAMTAMEAGADFIKTSTGKSPIAATPEAAVVMCSAIKAYHQATGKKVGFKAAGGIATPEQATLYYTIVQELLGEEWLTPEHFRIGASALANELLGAIVGRPLSYF